MPNDAALVRTGSSHRPRPAAALRNPRCAESVVWPSCRADVHHRASSVLAALLVVVRRLPRHAVRIRHIDGQSVPVAAVALVHSDAAALPAFLGAGGARAAAAADAS